MSRRGCSLPANASSVDAHRASITSRFGQVDLPVPGDNLRLYEALVSRAVLRAAVADG
jgi:hypothetical protein